MLLPGDCWWWIPESAEERVLDMHMLCESLAIYLIGDDKDRCRGWPGLQWDVGCMQ